MSDAVAGEQLRGLSLCLLSGRHEDLLKASADGWELKVSPWWHPQETAGRNLGWGTLPHELSKTFWPLLGICKLFTGLRSWHGALGRLLLLYSNSWSSDTSNGTSPLHLHTWIIPLQNKLKTTGRAGNHKNSSYSSLVCTVKIRL